MEDSTTQSLVSTVEAEYVRRGTYVAGFLTLTQEWLHFARMSEQGPELLWKTPIKAVQSADVDMVRNTVSFEFQDRRHTVRGAGVFALHKEFVSLSWSITREEEARLVSDGDGVLLEGRASLSLDNGSKLEGALAITNTGIRFLSDHPVDANQSAIQGLSARLDRISGIRLSGFNRCLELRVGNHTYQFWGQIIPRAYGVLTTLVGHKKVDPTAESDILTWSIGRFRGIVLQNGELMVTNRRMTFLPMGKLDSFMGLDQEWHLERKDIQTLYVDGIGGRKLHVRDVGDRVTTFEQPQAREHLETLLAVLLHDPHQKGGRSKLPTMNVNRLIPWKSALPNLRDGDLLYSSSGFYLEEEYSARFGSILLGLKESYFLPNLANPTHEDAITFRTERLRPPEPGEVPAGRLHLNDGARNGTFVLGNKSIYSTDFWQLWRREMDRSGKGHFHPSLKPGGENRRETFRAELPGALSTEISFHDEEGEMIRPPLKASCLDISIGGCCVVADEAIPNAPVLSILLPTVEEGRYKQLRIQCAHKTEVGQFGEKWRHGLRFLDLTEEDADEVEHLVMKLQRDEAFSRAVRRAGIEE